MDFRIRKRDLVPAIAALIALASTCTGCGAGGVNPFDDRTGQFPAQPVESAGTAQAGYEQCRAQEGDPVPGAPVETLPDGGVRLSFTCEQCDTYFADVDAGVPYTGPCK